MKEKGLHSKFFNNVKDVADERSWQEFVVVTEAYDFAAQEEGLRTMFLRVKIEKEDVSPLCVASVGRR